MLFHSKLIVFLLVPKALVPSFSAILIVNGVPFMFFSTLNKGQWEIATKYALEKIILEWSWHRRLERLMWAPIWNFSEYSLVFNSFSPSLWCKTCPPITSKAAICYYSGHTTVSLFCAQVQWLLAKELRRHLKGMLVKKKSQNRKVLSSHPLILHSMEMFIISISVPVFQNNAI